MRIRNSRPPLPLPSPSDPTSRFTHLPSRNDLSFDDRFLVQETNRRIGWSCYHLENCMQEKSNQALGGRHEAQSDEADEGNGPCLPNKDNKDGNASTSAVKFGIAQTFASSELGGEVAYAKKKRTCLLETELERGIKEDAKPDKKMELRNISHKIIEDENGSKRTRALFCPTHCEYSVTPKNEGFERPGMHGEMSLEYTVVETKEEPRSRRGRKRKVINLEMRSGLSSTNPMNFCRRSNFSG